MNICTMTDFREALRRPGQYFTTLTDIIPDTATFGRTTLFAECRAQLHGKPVMLYAPITTTSIEHAMRAKGTMRTADSRDFITVEILHNELLCPRSDMRCTIVIERLPYGETLDELLRDNADTQLQQGIDELMQRMHYYNISHNNLTSKNIIVDDDYRLWPIRQYYTTSGAGGDEASFATLRTKIKQRQLLSDIYADPHDETQNRRRYHALIEGRRRRISDEGIGFEDENGKLVIACQYAWVDDFAEGRAVVISHDNRAGLIDKQGAYIIPMRYDDIVYDVQTGISEVYDGEVVAHFDYEGKQLDEWQERHAEAEYEY